MDETLSGVKVINNPVVSDYGYGTAGRTGYNGLDITSMSGICDLRHEVAANATVAKDTEANIRREIAKSEADIRADVHASECSVAKQMGAAECTIIKEIIENKYALATAIQKSEYESKLNAQVVIKELCQKIDAEAQRTNDKVEESKDFNAEKFCQLENVVKDGFSTSRIAGLEDKVEALRENLQTAQLSRLICCGCPTCPNDNGNGNGN